MRILSLLIIILSFSQNSEYLEDLFRRASKWRVGSAVNEVESARDTIRMLGDSVILYLLKRHIKTNKTLELRALKAIMKDKQPVYMKALRQYINSPNDTVRLAAIYLAGELKDSGSVSSLVKAIEDTSIRIKLNAMLSLGKIGDTSFGKILCRELERAKEEKVKLVALRSIGEMKYDGCVGEVIKMLADEKSVIKYAAVNALSKIGRDAFNTIIKDPEFVRDFYKVYALVDIVKYNSNLTIRDTILARRAFTRAFKEQDPAMRILAVRGFCSVMDETGKDLLKKWLFYEQSSDVRFEINLCLLNE